MASKDVPNAASHKRTSSTAENTTTPPPPKRKAQDSSTKTSPNQTVYIVLEKLSPTYTDSATQIHGVYATLKDANNAVIRICSDEYSGVEEFSRGTDEDGKVYWRSGDTGEGDGAEVTIEMQVIRAPGSEKEREWGDEEEEEQEDDEGGNGDRLAEDSDD